MYGSEPDLTYSYSPLYLLYARGAGSQQGSSSACGMRSLHASTHAAGSASGMASGRGAQWTGVAPPGMGPQTSAGLEPLSAITPRPGQAMGQTQVRMQTGGSAASSGPLGTGGVDGGAQATAAGGGTTGRLAGAASLQQQLEALVAQVEPTSQPFVRQTRIFKILV